MMRRLLPALLFLLPGVLGAQAATYTYINQKAPYKNPRAAMLKALNLPKIGTTFKVQVPGGLRSLTYALATGVSNPSIRFDVLGGYLFTSAELVVGVPTGPKLVTISLAIPNSSQLLGVKFYQQVLEVSKIYLPWTLNTLSRGGVGVIGK
jgi:hypothetical protein